MWQNLTLLLSLTLFFHFPSVNSVSQLAPALYVLGDSLVDSGNNNFLPTLAKANFLPYGVNFTGGATGRFTNGKTVADFIAEFLGLPFSPPYLSFGGSVTVVTGVNYASGSCGILPETGNYIGKCLNLDNQLDLFQRTVQVDLPKHYESTEKLSEYLSKSMFVVSIGSNDYINNYLQSNIYNTSRSYTPQSFAQLLISTLSQKLQRLYKLGARKVVVFEIGPLGCLPSITKHTIHDGQCVEQINQLVPLFNNQLGPLLKNLTATLPGSAFSLAHINSISYNAITNPSTYGFTDTINPCCVTEANTTAGCIPGLAPCPDINKHYFWDGFHLTEIVYSTVAKSCINDNSVCIPMNIKGLVQY